MAKRKRTKGQTTIYYTLHRTLEIEQHEPGAPEGYANPSSTCDTLRVTLVTKPSLFVAYLSYLTF